MNEKLVKERRQISPLAASIHVLLTEVSENEKLGPMAASITGKQSCPSTCPLKDAGCYAGYGPLSWQWQGVTEGRSGKPWVEFCDDVRKLRMGRCYRHDQTGDLPPEEENKLDREACIMLAESAQHLRPFTYCHYPVLPTTGVSREVTDHNLEVLREMNGMGFTVNLSGDSMAHADELRKTGLPVVAVFPVVKARDAKEPEEGVRAVSVKGRHPTVCHIPKQTPDGNPLVICPFYTVGLQCIDCRLCIKKDRKSIVAFPAHGSGRFKVGLS